MEVGIESNEDYLKKTYGTKEMPMVAQPLNPSKMRLSKIEVAGEQVMDHLMKLIKDTDLSFKVMAKRMNELYGLNLTHSEVWKFCKTNQEVILQLASEKEKLGLLRSKLYLEANGALVKDIKVLDIEIGKMIDEDMLEPDRRAKSISDLIDKKGRLLIRHAKLNGKLDEKPNTKIEKMQVNVYQQVNEEKSDVMKRLKKAEFKDENAKTNS